MRVVVDLEGKLITTFPVAVEKRLTTLAVRGVTVAASVAPLAFLSALAETEGEAAADDAAKRSEAAQRSSWVEKVLEFFGPYGVLDSSPIAIEPNFVAIRRRSDAALVEARACLGRDLTDEERGAIRQSVYNAWADAAARAAAA